VGISKIRHALIAGLVADIAGILALLLLPGKNLAVSLPALYAHHKL